MQLLRGVDRAAFAVALVSRMRGAGLQVGVTAAADLCRALASVPPTSRARLYWAARITLVRRHADLAAFDGVFAAVVDDAMRPLDPHSRRVPFDAPGSDDDRLAPAAGDTAPEADGIGLPWLTLPRTVNTTTGAETDLVVPLRAPSVTPGLVDEPFERLTDAEVAELGRWLAAALRHWPTRCSRRYASARSGPRVSLRATIARSRRTGFEPVHLVHVRTVPRARPVVLLCDVSQSMQAQTVAYLHLMRAFTLHADAEVFAFSTRLTRLTTVLSHRSEAAAVAMAGDRVTDRFGGTRIASNPAALLGSHHGSSARGAVVVIASDGWDADSPEELAAVMARLHRRAHRVVWVNPRAGAREFTPTVASMAAALPYCDALLSGDTFASLARVLEEVAPEIPAGPARLSRT